MNLNHDPDKQLLDQIDKLIETRQPTENTLLDELATTRPIPRTAFQNALEERLLVRFEHIKQGESSMVNTTSYMPFPAPRRNWLPLTLLAALIVVAIAGVMLINGRGKSMRPNEIALAAVTATATSADYTALDQTVVPTVSNATLSARLQPNRVAVSIPLARLTNDSLIPGVGGDVDIVALLSFKATNPNLDTMPVTIMPDGTRTVEKVLIQGAMVIFHSPISQSNPPDQSATITFAVSPDDSRQLAWLGEQSQVTFRLQKPLQTIAPMGSSIVALPFDSVTADENIQPGDRVNIVSICAFVPDALGSNTTTSKTDCSQVTNAIRALNVRVVFGEILVNGKLSVKTSNSISLAVPEDSLPMFAQMIDARMHFKLVKSGTVNQPTPTPLPIPSGKVNIDIPRAQIAPLAEGMSLHAGSTAVDVIVSLAVKDLNDQAPSQFQQLVSAQQANSQLSQRVVRGALVVQSGDILTLQVTSDEAKVIQWLLSTKILLTVRPALPASTSGNSPATLQLHLDSLSSWATDEPQVGDTVDMVMAFVIGIDKTFQLDFQQYSAASWGDKLSHGEITANIYAPSVDIAGSDVLFLRRVVQNATVIALKTNIDPESTRMSSVDLTLEIARPMTSPTVESLKGYIQAKMPYLVVKHESAAR